MNTSNKQEIQIILDLIIKSLYISIPLESTLVIVW
jgi:hypothetical protein